MKICCLGDFHYVGFRRVLEETVRGAFETCRLADIVVIVGDISANGDLGLVGEVLDELKRYFDVPVLVVPGNHDLYLLPDERRRGVNSLDKLSMFNEFVEGRGCVPLMKKPLVLDGVGFVGSIGWYDYSFRPDWMDLGAERFREKTFGLSIWADRDFVELPFSDEEFAYYLAETLEKHVLEIKDSVDRVAIVLHHVPFRELVEYRHVPEWDYFSTFMGSSEIEYVIRKHSDKVKLVVYGHQHGEGVVTGVCREVTGIRACNCASPKPMLIEL